MVVSIQALTAPFVPLADRCFDKATNYIISKHPNANRAEVKHDVQVLIFDIASLIMASTIPFLYFRKISHITAFALLTFFYMVRRIIDQTIAPLSPSLTSNILSSITNLTTEVCGDKKLHKTVVEKIQSTFHQDDEIIISGMVILKLMHQSVPKMIGMIFTRT